MSKIKIAITLEESIVETVDSWVRKNLFPNRSRAIQEAIKDKLAKIERRRLAYECSKLDHVFEKSIAEEGLSNEISEWPEY